MTKGIKFFVKFVSIVVCMFVSANFFSACSSSNNADKTYSITGYVFDELGNAVEGASITSDFVSTQTDTTGKYTISNLGGSLVLSVSKEGYHFEVENKYITSAKDDANFVAYKEYTVSGTAHNNEIAVPNANVVVSSLTGDYYTVTDEYGNFTVTGVAGQTQVSCEVDNLQFYKATATIETPNVEINTTSSLTINLEDATKKNLDFSKIELWVNGNKIYLASNEKILKNISCGTIVELKSSYYNFSGSSKFVVSSLNQVENFVLDKIYSLTGYVKSGSTPLEGANIYVDGKLTTTADNKGFFDISNLWSTKNISVEYVGFDFSDVIASESNTLLNFNGTKDVVFTVSYDHKLGSDLTFSVSNYEKDTDNSYTLFDLCLGEEVAINSSAYYLKKNNYVVDSANNYEVECFAKYNASVSGIERLNAQILLDGESAELSDLIGLYGVHIVSASYDNYVFNQQSVNAKNSVANLTYVIPYNIELNVTSGDLVLSNASAKIDEQNVYQADENGKIIVENVLLGTILVVSADGYNSKIILIEDETSKNISLTYDVSGYVKTGDYAVSQVQVKAGTFSTTSNAEGYFELKNLEGQLAVSVEKEGFEFNSISIKECDELEFSGTYSITGSLSSDDYDVSSFVVKLRNVSTSNTLSCNATNGIYAFEGLTGKYILYVENDTGSVGLLKPNSYTISEAGSFNFSSSGFKVSGYVKSGDVPIDNAKVTAGATSVYTDSNGYYVFELLTSTCSVSVQKQGYEFSDSIEVLEDAENVNFSATYSVSGNISISGTTLSGVAVYVNDEFKVNSNESGSFVISGLTGTNELSFTKENYYFITNISVSGYDSVSVSDKDIKLEVSVQVLSGEVEVFGYDYFINGVKAGTESSSTTNIQLFANDVISFEKTGYEIENVIPACPGSFVTSATYSVIGSVVSGTEKIEDFEIYVNGKKVSIVADENKFEISGLSGEITLTASKAGFAFEIKNISAYESNAVFNGTYKISGYVFVGSKILSNVLVTINDSQSVQTDESGKFEFDSISGKFNLSFEKEGYTFSSIANKFGEQKLTVEAFYMISGNVKSGDLVVSGASVTLVTQNSSDERYATTDVNGYFEFVNVSGVTNIIVSKDGYTSVTVSGYNDLSLNCLYNLKYSITINFDISGVSVSLNGKTTIVSGKVYNLSNLEGTNTLIFSLENTTFKPQSKIIVTSPQNYNITSEKAYDAYGHVKTDAGVAVAGITIESQSGLSAVTDLNGYYELNNIAGDIYLIDDNITKETKTVSANGEYSFTVATNEFAFRLYAEAIKKLDNASSVQIFGSGSVVGDASIMKTTQYAYALYKRDTKGNIIKQNLNYGESVMGIDPRVSLVVLTLNGSTLYQTVSGSSVTSKTTANHTVSGLTSIEPSAVKSTYGSNPTDYSTYNVSKSTATVSNFTYNSSTKAYQFKFTLSNSSQSGYSTQIEALAPSGTTFKGFNLIELTININKDGWITSIKAYDEYEINQTVNVDITSTITYTYHTNKPNLKIDDITIKDSGGQNSDTALNNSLLLSAQTEIAETSAVAYSINNYDVVANAIYGNI